MEHGTLRALLTDQAPRLLPAAQALAILGDVSDALFPTHAAGRGYGVFGPDSVELTGGAATLAASPAFDPEYAAPEMRDGAEPAPSGDAYAYAALAHLLLTGDLPEFDDAGSPVPVPLLHPGFPAFAGEAIARALQPDPAARPLPKVLFTLLRVVPLEKWPTATVLAVVPEPVEEPEPVEAARPEPEPAPVTAPEAEDWQRLVRTDHEVPRIEWARDAQPDPLSIPRIDWKASGDPTRPSATVPDVSWWTDTAAEGAASAPAAAEEHPVARPATESHDAPPAVDVSWWTDRVAPETADRNAAGNADDGAASTHDPTFLHDFVQSLMPSGEVPEIEPLEESIPEERMQHRPGKRSRRKHHDSNRTQKVVLVLVLLVLIAVGVVWALSHKDSPKYDPKLQGASRSLSHPVSVRE